MYTCFVVLFFVFAGYYTQWNYLTQREIIFYGGDFHNNCLSFLFSCPQRHYIYPTTSNLNHCITCIFKKNNNNWYPFCCSEKNPEFCCLLTMEINNQAWTKMRSRSNKINRCWPFPADSIIKAVRPNANFLDDVCVLRWWKRVLTFIYIRYTIGNTCEIYLN